jgi:hypothetical protein
MTMAAESTMASRVGRKLRWPERIGAKFPPGTLARITRVLEKGEVRLDFIRAAVEAELERRERKPAKKPRSR